MTNTYTIYLRREISATFSDVVADSPEDAASMARGFATGGADRIDDCQDLSALVKLDDPAQYQPPVTLDFEPERLRKAAPEMLDALRLAQNALNTAPRFRVGNSDSYKIAAIVDRAIAEATAA